MIDEYDDGFHLERLVCGLQVNHISLFQAPVE